MTAIISDKRGSDSVLSKVMSGSWQKNWNWEPPLPEYVVFPLFIIKILPLQSCKIGLTNQHVLKITILGFTSDSLLRLIS